MVDPSSNHRREAQHVGVAIGHGPLVVWLLPWERVGWSGDALYSRPNHTLLPEKRGGL